MAKAARLTDRFGLLFLLALALLGAFVIHLGMGGTWLTPMDVWQVLIHRSPDDLHYAVVWDIRLPRALACVFVGAMLAITGSSFQALFRNPLSDPYTVGVSSGAAVGGVAAIVFGLDMRFGALGVMVLAFVGGLLSLALVFSLARRRGMVEVTTLLLAGVVVGSLLSAVMTTLLYLAGQDTNRVLQWLLGSMSTIFWDKLWILGIAMVAGTVILLLQARKLNAFAIGESTAKHLGVDTRRLKTIVLVTGTALSAVCVGAVGIIGFLGLVAPHIARRWIGVDWRYSMPTALLLGPIILLISDMLAQRAIPGTELPVGAVIAILGSPFLLVLLRRADERG